MKDTPETYLLSYVPWQLFASLTWAGSKSSGLRIRTLFAWLRTLGEWSGVHFHRVLWLAREEHGEVGGREHYHVLVGGLRSERLSIGFNHAARNEWKRLGGGFARVRAYEADAAGVSYVLKGDAEKGANHYEAQKFGKARWGMTSKSTVKLLLARAVAIEPGSPTLPSLRKGA